MTEKTFYNMLIPGKRIMNGHALCSYSNLEIQWHTVEQESRRGRVMVEFSSERPSNNSLVLDVRRSGPSHAEVCRGYSPTPSLKCHTTVGNQCYTCSLSMAASIHPKDVNSGDFTTALSDQE